ncbi:MAG TPA: cyclase family protein [Acidobacteriaceae bacterium]|jgi:kynurenine formamidase
MLLMATSLLAQSNPPNHMVTQQDLDRWLAQDSNWGRWGKDDQRGTLNLITPAKIKQATALVKDGVAVSLALTMDTEKAVDNPTPFEDVMTRDGSTGNAVSDRISSPYHSGVTTHMNAVGHRLTKGAMYNGFPAKDYVTMSQGMSKDSIINIKDGVFTRGIFFDIPQLKGVPYLEPGTPIYAEDLEAWEKRAGVKVGPGDAIFIDTGRWKRREKLGPWAVTKQVAGLDASVIPWLKRRGVAVIGSDALVAVRPAPPTTQLNNPDENFPAEDFSLYGLGITLIENCDFRALAEAATARKRWQFLFMATPLPIPHGTGSPVNPIAMF